MTPQAVIVPPKLVDVRAATAAENDMLRGCRGKNTIAVNGPTDTTGALVKSLSCQPLLSNQSS